MSFAAAFLSFLPANLPKAPAIALEPASWRWVRVAAAAGDAQGGAERDSIMSKAERVYKALLWEHATGESDLVVAAAS